MFFSDMHRRIASLDIGTMAAIYALEAETQHSKILSDATFRRILDLQLLEITRALPLKG